MLYSIFLYKILLDKILLLLIKISMYDFKLGYWSLKKGLLNIGLFFKIFINVDFRGEKIGVFCFVC